MRDSVRNVALWLVERVPVAGGSIVRAVENHWPSRRERAQAALIAEQAAHIVELQDELFGQREQIGELEYRLERALLETALVAGVRPGGRSVLA